MKHRVDSRILLFIPAILLFVSTAFCDTNQSPVLRYAKAMQKFGKAISTKKCTRAEQSLEALVNAYADVAVFSESQRRMKRRAKNNTNKTEIDLKKFRHNAYLRSKKIYSNIVKNCHAKNSGVKPQTRRIRRIHISKERRMLANTGMRFMNLIRTGQCDEAKPVMHIFITAIVDSALRNARRIHNAGNINQSSIRQKVHAGSMKVYGKMLARCYAKKSGRKFDKGSITKSQAPTKLLTPKAAQAKTKTDGCIEYSASWDNTWINVEIKNNCPSSLHLSICMNIPKHAPFAIEKKSKVIDAKSTHVFKFMSVEQPVYKYAIRQCASNKSGTCRAKCP